MAPKQKDLNCIPTPPRTTSQHHLEGGGVLPPPFQKLLRAASGNEPLKICSLCTQFLRLGSLLRAQIEQKQVKIGTRAENGGYAFTSVITICP